jgi:small subunit ribosomal protein S6
MEQPQRLYESTFIVNASLDDGQVEGVIGRVQDVISKNGGAVTAVNKWGRKRLSYSINKKTNGFYVNIEFQAPGQLLATLERAFQLDEMILRYLTIVVDPKVIAARAAAAAAAQAEAPGREPLFGETPGEKRS